MLTPVLLWQVKVIHPLLRRAGVDIAQFETILRTKLLLDQHGGPKGSLPISGVYTLMMSGFWLFGLMLAIPTIFIAKGSWDLEPALWLGGVQTIMAVMIAFPLITQYASLLVDATDIHMISPTPVNSATLFASRLVHAAIYTGVLAACLAFGPLVAGVFAYAWWAVLIVFPLATLLTVILVVSMIGAFYGAALRIFGPRHFERITLWIQVAFISMSMGGGHLLFQSSAMKGAVQALIEDPAKLIWIPTMHVGALLEVLSGFEPTRERLVWSALALALPAFAVWLSVKLASRHFIDGLTGHQVSTRRGRGWRGSGHSWMSRTASTRLEAAAMPLTWSMIRHDKLLVRAIWPTTLGMLVLGLAVPMSMADAAETFDLAPKWFAVTIFLAAIADVAAVDMLRITQNGAAAWIYAGVAHAEQHDIFRGAYKAALFGALLPAKIVIVGGLALVVGPSVIAPAILATMMTMALTFRSLHALKAHLPFTLTPTSQVNQDLSNLGPYLLAMAGQAALALVFAALIWHPVGLVVGFLVTTPLLIRAFRKLVDLEVEALTFE